MTSINLWLWAFSLGIIQPGYQLNLLQKRPQSGPSWFIFKTVFLIILYLKSSFRILVDPTEKLNILSSATSSFAFCLSSLSATNRRTAVWSNQMGSAGHTRGTNASPSDRCGYFDVGHPPRWGKDHFPTQAKCHPCRSNSGLINYTRNLWTTKCQPETSHLTGLWGGHGGTVLMWWRRKVSFVGDMKKKKHSNIQLCAVSVAHTRSHTRCHSAASLHLLHHHLRQQQRHHLPLPPLSANGSDRSGHTLYILLIVSKPAADIM